jgi:hypothetical protein
VAAVVVLVGLIHLVEQAVLVLLLYATLALKLEQAVQ